KSTPVPVESNSSMPLIKCSPLIKYSPWQSCSSRLQAGQPQPTCSFKVSRVLVNRHCSTTSLATPGTTLVPRCFVGPEEAVREFPFAFFSESTHPTSREQGSLSGGRAAAPFSPRPCSLCQR